jgi:hypothetical protein
VGLLRFASGLRLVIGHVLRIAGYLFLEESATFQQIGDLASIETWLMGALDRHGGEPAFLAQFQAEAKKRILRALRVTRGTGGLRPPSDGLESGL